MSTEKQHDELMVTIRCITYNHEQYIRQCLEGFVMQKANFRYEAIVHDDASTDGTAAIIHEYAEKYPDIIKPIFETENQYSKKDGSLRRIMNAHTHGKYVAMCEGDDYWTDPLKLQKQVDFLERNIEYSLIHTDYQELFQKKQIVKRKNANRKKTENTFNALLLGKYQIGTLTVMLRRELFNNVQSILSEQKFVIGDLPLWLLLSTQGKVFYMKDCTATYRILDSSASHFTNKIKAQEYNIGVYILRHYFIQKYKRLIESQPKAEQFTNKLFIRKSFALDIPNANAQIIPKTSISFIDYIFLLMLRRSENKLVRIIQKAIRQKLFPYIK